MDEYEFSKESRMDAKPFENTKEKHTLSCKQPLRKEERGGVERGGAEIDSECGDGSREKR